MTVVNRDLPSLHGGSLVITKWVIHERNEKNRKCSSLPSAKRLYTLQGYLPVFSLITFRMNTLDDCLILALVWKYYSI